MSASSEIFFRIGSLIFLIFWINLMVQNTRQVTRVFDKAPDKNSWAKRAKKGPKWTFSTFSQNRVITFSRKHAKMLDIMVRMYDTPSGKTLVWQNFGENARPIRLLHFQTAVTSKLFGGFLKFFVIFWMKLKYHQGNKQKIIRAN